MQQVYKYLQFWAPLALDFMYNNSGFFAHKQYWKTIQTAVREYSHVFQQLHSENAQVCPDGAQEKQHSQGLKAQSYSVASKAIETQHLETCQAEIQSILFFFYKCV